MRILLLAAVVAGTLAGDGYKQAPADVRAILDAPATPTVSVSPARTHALIMRSRRYPPVAELAEPMLRLAGYRINPRTNGPHRGVTLYEARLLRLDTGAEIPMRVPAQARLWGLAWSGDGARFAVLNTAQSGIELWVGRTATGELRKIEGVRVNGALGDGPRWMPDGRTLLVSTIPEGRGQPPAAPERAPGPVVEESAGKAGPARTNPDMLQNAHDEALFEYYATAQLALVDTNSGRMSAVGRKAIVLDAEPSPDGRYLLVTWVHRPFSYLLPASAFPREIEVWDTAGNLVRKLASKPLADRVPIEGVPVGPRRHEWRATEPATLTWAEALDEGDPRKKVPHRDRLMIAAAPFDQPREWFRTEHRFMSLRWLETGGQALVADYDRNRRWTQTKLVTPLDDGVAPRVLFSRSIQDRYGDPGAPVTRTLASGQTVVAVHEGAILLSGAGASPKGDRPFLDRMGLGDGKKERLFQCDEQSFEMVVSVLDRAGNRLLTRRESPADPPNYHIREAGRLTLALTRETDPAPELRRVKKELVTYQREDGVPLSFTLYLPPDYQPGTPLPTVLWAYPLEFNDPATAGQVSGSTQRFTMLSGLSHLFFLLRGYAILDGAAMPVVGDPETVNNTYIEQVVASAKAAIDKAAAMGVTDPKRVGVGGHSYGAFMTANLLAHSDLFRAGIARSGAYNRTLTPFGFQSERRTLWEAPETYLRMSPFLYAHKINEPILLIHGMADNNQGTFPIQSERMYQAVRGNGGVVRYVQLPYESHGYEARESVEHTLAEMIEWFEKHVKGAGR